MSHVTQRDRSPRGITILDLLLFTAGFACGWVMHQASALRASHHYILPLSRGGFQSLLGSVWVGWLWAFVVGLALLAVARRFRYDCRGHAAEWLAVAITIVLFESVYPAFRPDRVTAMTGETVWIAASADPDSPYAVDRFGSPRGVAGSPGGGSLAFYLWWPKNGENWPELARPALCLTMAAAMIAIAAWSFRSRLSSGWLSVFAIVIAVIITLGPLRLAESTAIEVSSCAQIPAYQPSAGENPWSWPSIAAYYDARAWAGYSLRALALVNVAMLASLNLFSRWRQWSWTEWAAFVSASIIAGCWCYDEFVARPALDRGVRVTLIAGWLFVLAVTARGLIRALSGLARRFLPANATGDNP